MSKKGFDYLISEIYSIPTTNESYIDKIVKKAKEIKNSEEYEEISDVPHSTITDQIDAIIFELPLKEKIKLYELIEELYEELDKNQKEISDNDIYEEADYQFRHFEQSKKDIWVNACKWYREKLRNRSVNSQNNIQ